MFRKQIDILAIGDLATDAFIRLKDAHVNCKINTGDCELCFRFGDKVPFEYVKVVKAVGNAGNAAVSASRLGLRTALLSDVGGDQHGKDALAELQKQNVVTSHITVHPSKSTNYHFVLWFGAERTILTNHANFDYKMKDLPPPKWMYLTSLADHSLAYQMQIANYLDKHPEVKLAFQPGTFQIKLGHKPLDRFYKRADFIAMNTDEARRILGFANNSSNSSSKNSKKEPANESNLPHGNDIKVLLSKIHSLGPKLVAITDNTAGSYLFDGDHYYHMPMYPDPRPPFERTGCGDAWSSTFVSALALGKSPLEALVWAPVNPMSVAQFIGSQEGLLTREQLEWWLTRAPEDYKPREF